MKKKDVFLTLIAIAALFGVACFVQTEMDSYIRRIVNLCLVYAIIGLSMNLTNGFVGQFSLGQAGFMAIGAYVVGIFTVPVELRPNVFYAAPMNPLIADIQMPLWLALIAGGLLAALVAFLIGTPVLRLRGDYLAVATLGFSEIIRIWITNAQSITNGALGIKDIPPLNDVRYYIGQVIPLDNEVMTTDNKKSISESIKEHSTEPKQTTLTPVSYTHLTLPTIA